MGGRCYNILDIHIEVDMTCERKLQHLFCFRDGVYEKRTSENSPSIVVTKLFFTSFSSKYIILVPMCLVNRENINFILDILTEKGEEFETLSSVGKRVKIFEETAYATKFLQ